VSNLKDVAQALGTPIPVVEIQISLRKKIVRVVMATREHTKDWTSEDRSASIDLPLDDWLRLDEGARSVKNLGEDVTKAMREHGLIGDTSKVKVFDLDSVQVQ
jgi:hypothetical protein